MFGNDPTLWAIGLAWVAGDLALVLGVRNDDQGERREVVLAMAILLFLLAGSLALLVLSTLGLA